MFREKSILCCFFGDTRLLLAEVRATRKSAGILRLVEWPLPAAVTDGEEIGRALRKHLREKRIPPMPVVFGIPLRWVSTRNKAVPPGDRESLAALIRLEAESDFALPAGELELDYFELASSRERKEKKVFLAALGKARKKHLQAIARGARFKVTALTITNLSSAVQLAARNPDAMSLHIGPEAAEIFHCEPGGFITARHLCLVAGRGESAGDWQAGAAAETGRMISLMPGKPPGEIIICRNYPLSETEINSLREKLPLPSRTGSEKAGPGAEPTCAAASAIAGERKRRARVSIDFFHPHIEESARKRTLRRPVAAVIVLVALLAALAGAHSLNRLERENRLLTASLAESRPGFEAALAGLSYLEALEAWSISRTPFLDCLREITLAYPTGGGIWATAVNIRENMRGTITGRAENSRLVLETLDRLARSSSFREVKLLHVRDGGTRENEVNYAIEFIFNPETGSRENREKGNAP